MKTNKGVAAPDPRGYELDRRLDAVLAEMLREGASASPISRATVQERLRLKSRSTLVGKRGDKVNEAREKQLHEAGLPSKRKGRPDVAEKFRLLQEEVVTLRSIRDSYITSLMEIVKLLQREGLVVEDHLAPLRSGNRE